MFETDCLMSLDRTLLIVEAKSSRLTLQALRAAPGSLKRLVEKVILDPSLQSARLSALIEGAKKGDHDSQAICRRLGVRALDVDLVIRLSITLDDFSFICTAEEVLRTAKWISKDHALPVTMTIHDLRHVIQILDNPIFTFHYLHERYFLQKRYRIVADELDLLGAYLHNVLNMNQAPARKSDLLIFANSSEVIDRFYNARDAGFVPQKPTPCLRPLFRSALEKLFAETPQGWTTVGRYLLSCADYEQQKVVERKLSKLRKHVRRKWRQRGHKCSLVVQPPEMHKAVVVFYLFPEELRSESIDRAKRLTAEIFDSTGRKGCCVLVRSIDDWQNPYEAMILVRPDPSE